MNWTGGSLQRTKKPGNVTLQKQKAYFARTRTRLQNGHDSTQFELHPSQLGMHDKLEVHVRPWSSERDRTSYRVSRADVPSIQVSSRVRGDRHGKRVSHDTLYHETGNISKDGKRNACEAGLETQLLEANKRRLLGRSDWAGLTSSKPVYMRVEFVKEKERVGKRRNVAKLQENRPHQKEANRPRGRQLQSADHGNENYMSGALQVDQEDLNIRFGTDALTTTYSTQNGRRTLSLASSDSMLLDERPPGTGAKEGSIPVVDDGASYHAHVNNVEPLKNHWLATGDAGDQCSRNHFQSFIHPSDADLGSPRQPRGMAKQGSKAKHVQPLDDGKCVTPSPQMMQHVGDELRPLRLLFGTDTTAGDWLVDTALGRANESRTMHEQHVVHAGTSQSRLLHAARSEVEDQPGSEAADSAAILNEEPWRTFLAVSGDHSSRSLGSTQHERHHMHASCSVEDMTDRDGIVTSSMRRDLQPIRQVSRSTASAGIERTQQASRSDLDRPAALHARDRSNVRPSNGSCDDEKLWQNFVFGGLQVSSPRSLYGASESQQASFKGSSGYLPMSAAVSSIGASPFKSFAPPAPRIEENAINFAHPSRSPNLSSPEARPLDGSIGKADPHRGNNVSGGVVNRSVTHASLWNNASCNNDSISSRIFSNTGAFRSGSRYSEQTISSTSRRAHPSGSTTWRQVDQLSLPNTYDSADDELNLIDPNIID